MLGPPAEFTADPTTLRKLRQTHLNTMKIFGHMLSTIGIVDDTHRGMFR